MKAMLTGTLLPALSLLGETLECFNIKDRPQDVINKAIRNAKSSRTKCSNLIDKLGQHRIETITKGIIVYAGVFKEIDNVAESKGSSDLKANEELFAELKELSRSASAIACSDDSEAVVGKIAAWGAYGVNVDSSFKISDLDDCMGVDISAIEATKEAAFEDMEKAKETAELLQAVAAYYNGVASRARMLDKFLEELDVEFNDRRNALFDIIGNKGCDYNRYAVEDMAVVTDGLAILKVIKAVLELPILNEDGLPADEFTKVADDTEVYLANLKK